MFKKCARKLGAMHNHCAACGEYFNSDTAFESHRIGEFGVDRRCATVAEMITMGMSKNPGDWWITKEMVSESNPSQRRKAKQARSDKVSTQGAENG